MTVTKYVYEQRVSIELLFDWMPWSEMPMWLRKEWLRRGHGMGRTGPVSPLP